MLLFEGRHGRAPLRSLGEQLATTIDWKLQRVNGRIYLTELEMKQWEQKPRASCMCTDARLPHAAVIREPNHPCSLYEALWPRAFNAYAVRIILRQLRTLQNAQLLPSDFCAVACVPSLYMTRQTPAFPSHPFALTGKLAQSRQTEI